MNHAPELIFVIAQRCFGGRLPGGYDPDRIVDVLIRCLFPNTPPELLVYIKPALHDAVEKYLWMEYCQCVM